MTRRAQLTVLGLIWVVAATAAASQAVDTARAGSLTEHSVAAAALKSNQLGDPATSRVAVYLPPSYAASPQRRYPTLYLVEQYRGNLAKLRGIYLDYGALEEFSHIRTATRAFSEELTNRGIAHTFEVYADGNHENRIRQRIETRVLRFFSEVLAFPSS